MLICFLTRCSITKKSNLVQRPPFLLDMVHIFSKIGISTFLVCAFWYCFHSTVHLSIYTGFHFSWISVALEMSSTKYSVFLAVEPRVRLSSLLPSLENFVYYSKLHFLFQIVLHIQSDYIPSNCSNLVAFQSLNPASYFWLHFPSPSLYFPSQTQDIPFQVLPRMQFCREHISSSPQAA